MKNLKSFWPHVLCGLVVLGLGLYVRLYPLFSLNSSESSEKATVLVLSRLRSGITDEINQKFSGLPESQRNRLIEERFNNVLRDDGAKAREAIDRVATFIETRSPIGHREKYLLGSDSYYYYGLTKNITETGRIAEKTRGSKYFNARMLAPDGHWEPLTLHPFVGLGVYRLVKFFAPEATLMQGVSFTPLVIFALTVLLFFLICTLLRVDLVSSTIGALAFSLSPIFIKRSAFGWYDNDPYNILFPLAALGCLFAGLKHIHNMRRGAIWAASCAGMITLYAAFWQGWAYLLNIILLAGVITVICNHLVLKRKQDTIRLCLYYTIVLTGTLAGISLFLGADAFAALIREGLKALKDFTSPEFSLWPNVYLNVGELKSASVNHIVELTGGYTFFIVAIMGFAVSLWMLFKKRDAERYGFTLTAGIFLVFSFWITLAAQRFALLCVIPLGLFFSFGVQYLYDFAKRQSRMILPILLTSALIVVPVLNAARSTRSLLDPIFNPVWETALTRIEQHAPPEAIVNAWWPPGHFITSVARRRVTLDGATLNTPQAYWMARVFFSTDEKQAAGILRMLNNSANRSLEYLFSTGIPLSTAVDILLKIAPLDRSSARIHLHDRFDAEQIDTLLNLTHSMPPPSLLMVYREMMDKNLELSFVGRWNFAKAEQIRDALPGGRKILARGSKDYIQFLWNLTDGAFRSSEPLAQLNTDPVKLIFKENIVIHLDSWTCAIRSAKFGSGIPKSILYEKDGEVIEKTLPDANLNFSVVLLRDKKSHACILMDTELARSLLVRLYYFEGKGLRYFQPFTYASDLTGRTRVYVYNVDWAKFFAK